MENKTLHYDAFISYRHTQPDKFVAEKLHKELESFRLPGNVEKKLKKANPEAKTRITRVFRDEEELPLASNLEDPIIEALKNSDYLIVICSPRLKESLWCRKEIETFVELHGVDRVLTVLVEGEPEDSFPTELLNRERDAIDREGNHITIREKIEPLAADVRADNDKDRLKALKLEKLRLLAAMFNLNYDDLRQRHREQHMRRVIGLVSCISAICLLIGGLSTFTAITLSKKNEEIKAQAEEIEAKSYEIQLQSMSLEEQNEKLLTYQAQTLADTSLECLGQDDRYGAIQNAYYAMTSYDGNEMPYISTARLAMTKALNLYDITGSIRTFTTMQLNADLNFMKCSPSGDVAVLYDYSGTMTFWDTLTGKLMSVVDTSDYVFISTYATAFLDDNRFIFIDDDVMCIDVTTGNVDTFIARDSDSFLQYQELKYDEDNEVIYVFGYSDIYVFDQADGSLINQIDFPNQIDSYSFKAVGDGRYMFYTYTYDEKTFYIIDEDGNELFSLDVSGTSYKDAYVYGDTVYVLTNEEINPDSVLGGYTSVVTAYDIDTGNVVCSREDRNIYGGSLSAIYDEDGYYIVEVGTNGVAEFDMDTLDLEVIDIYNNSLLYSEIFEDEVAFITDEFGYLILNKHTTFGTNSLLQVNMANCEEVMVIDDGIMCHQNNSNKVILYRTIENPDIKNEGEWETREFENYCYNSAVEKATELGIPNATYVDAITYNADNSKLCVSYGDQTNYIYNAKDMSLWASFKMEEQYEMMWEYLGKDKNGNEYWRSGSNGYCFNENGELITIIGKMVNLDADKNLVYLSYDYDGATLYSAPIYSDEELIEIAEKYLD